MGVEGGSVGVCTSACVHRTPPLCRFSVLQACTHYPPLPAELPHCSQGILIYFVIIQNIIFHVLNNKDYVLNNKTLQSFKSSSSGHSWVVGRTWELLAQYSSEEIFILSFAYDHWVLSAQPPFYYLHRVADRFILFLKHSGQTVTLQIWIIYKGLKEWWLFWLQTVRAKWPML